MAKINWLPSSRIGVLNMGRSWRTPIGKYGESVWGMDAEKIAALENAVTSVENDLAIPEELRNAVTNEKLKNSCENLVFVMRDIKKRYFYVPPLTNSDLISLGLKPRDTTPTIHAAPMIQPTTKVSYKSAGLFELSIAPLDVIAPEDKDSYYGCKILYSVFLPTDAAPTDRTQLHESKFTRRKKEVFSFNSDDSGKRVYFCVRYENSKGEAGPWGPISSALIP